MRLIDYFRQGLARNPDGVALVDGERRVTWGEAAAVVESLASAMAAAGLGAGSRIAVYSPNDASAFLVILAGFRLGAVWAPMNARNSVLANEHWLGLTGCEALFYHSSLEAEALALSPKLRAPARLVCLDRPGAQGAPSLDAFLTGAGDPAPEPPDGPQTIGSLFPTGGTTGLSKAAQWSLTTWAALMDAFWGCLPAEKPPVHLVAGPMTHAAGVLALCALAGGATNVILSKPAPELVFEAIEGEGVTHLYLPPTVIYALLAHPDVARRDFRSLKYLVVAASPIAPAKLREAMEVFGPVVCQSYGQAEAPMFVTFLPTADLLAGPEERWSSCGRPTPGVTVAIMGPEGELLDAGRRGEIVVRGALVMTGYLGNPEATSAASAYGWHHTGDIGHRDEDGFVYIVDRAKDMIISGGFNIYSAEVEQVILEHPDVLDCAVIGTPDPKWGEAVTAIVQPKGETRLDAEELKSLVRARLGPVHTPKLVEIWDVLPRSPAGKVLKREIRDQYWIGHQRQV